MSSFMTPHFVCIASGWVRVDPEFLIHSEHKQAEATETAMPTIKCLVKALFAPETTYRPASSKTRWLVTARGPPDLPRSAAAPRKLEQRTVPVS